MNGIAAAEGFDTAVCTGFLDLIVGESKKFFFCLNLLQMARNFHPVCLPIASGIICQTTLFSVVVLELLAEKPRPSFPVWESVCACMEVSASSSSTAGRKREPDRFALSCSRRVA